MDSSGLALQSGIDKAVRFVMLLCGLMLAVLGYALLTAATPIMRAVLPWGLGASAAASIVFLALVLIVLSIASLLFAGAASKFAANASQTVGLRVLQSHKIVQIALQDTAALIAMRLEFGRAGMRKRLVGEMIRALDFAVKVAGDRAIWISTDAFNARTAESIGLRPRQASLSYRVSYLVVMKPTLYLLRLLTGGATHDLKSWELDREAYATFRAGSKAQRLMRVSGGS